MNIPFCDLDGDCAGNEWDCKSTEDCPFNGGECCVHFPWPGGAHDEHAFVDIPSGYTKSKFGERMLPKDLIAWWAKHHPPPAEPNDGRFPPQLQGSGGRLLLDGEHFDLRGVIWNGFEGGLQSKKSKGLPYLPLELMTVV